MYRKTGFLILLIFAATAAFPQQSLNTSNVDAATYELWLAQDWDGLIQLGKDATKAGIDFYYLRYRIGIAYYHKQNYHQAIRHLQKAFAANPTDPGLKEYLYYANNFINRKQEARIIAMTMTSEHRKRLGIQAESGMEMAEAWYNLNMADTDATIANITLNAALHEDGAQFIPKDHSYYSLDILHALTPKFSLFHAYTHIQKNHFIIGQTNNSGWTMQNAPSTLNQYYISGIVHARSKLEFVVGMHYINIRYPVEATVTRGQQTFIITSYESLHDITGSLSLYGHLPHLTMGGSFHMASLGELNQLQGDIMLAAYPTGNLNLYLISSISLQREFSQQTDNITRHVFHQQIGGKIAGPLWLEAMVAAGNLKNHIRNNGSLVYNTMDAITQQFGAKATITLSNRLSFNVIYTYAQHESNYISSQGASIPSNLRTYNSHSYTGGITWVF